MRAKISDDKKIIVFKFFNKAWLDYVLAVIMWVIGYSLWYIKEYMVSQKAGVKRDVVFYKYRGKNGLFDTSGCWECYGNWLSWDEVDSRERFNKLHKGERKRVKYEQKLPNRTEIEENVNTTSEVADVQE